MSRHIAAGLIGGAFSAVVWGGFFGALLWCFLVPDVPGVRAMRALAIAVIILQGFGLGFFASYLDSKNKEKRNA